MKTYCVSCKRDTENKNSKVFRTKSGRLMLRSIQCVEIKNLDVFLKMKDQVFYLL